MLTSLQIKRDLVQHHIIKINLTELLAYTRESNFDQLRLKAFRCLVDQGALQKPELLPYILNVIASDPSPYVRRNLLKIFTAGLGSVAIFGGKKEPQNKPNHMALGEMIVEEEGGDSMGETAMQRKKGLAREGIVGAMQALKEELRGEKGFAEALWKAIKYVVLLLGLNAPTNNITKITGVGHYGATGTA